MAEYPNLLQALQAGLTRPGDTSSGIGAQVIGTAIPALNNPYASTSSNLGHTLGASLLGGLLAGYARTQANEDNSELMPVMQQMLTAKTPEDRMALAASNPTRLSPLVQALAMQDFENKQGVDREVAKFKALSPLELQQRTDEKLIDYGFGQGKIPTDAGLVDVGEIGLKDPIEFEADRQTKLAQADADFRKQQLGAAGIDPKVGELPQDLQRPAIEQRQQQEGQQNRVAFIADQFDRAKNIGSISANLGYTQGAKELEVIKESLKQTWQLVTGKEMSGVALEEFNALVPKASDTKAIIEMKKQRFMQMMGGATQGTPMLEQALGQYPGGNTVQAPDGNTYVFTD